MAAGRPPARVGYRISGSASMTKHEPHTQHQAAYTAAVCSPTTVRAIMAALEADFTQPTVAELHRAICERVRDMREAGAQPESVLATIKRLAARAVADGGQATPDRSSEATALVSQVAQWCIAEYFRKP